MQNSENRKPVIVVGAGIAGLQAAYQLQMKSIPYLLLEQSGKVGGRLQTETLDGFLLDVGFQVLQTSYPGVQRNLDLSDLNLTFFESGAYVWVGDRFEPFLNPLKHPFLFFDSLMKGVITLADACKLAQLWFKIQGDLEPNRVGKNNVQEYFQQLNFSTKFYERFIYPFFAGVFLDATFQQPASLFDYYLKQFLEGKAALPQNGINSIAEQLKNRLHTGSILLNTQLLSFDSNKVQLSTGETLDYEKLILACDAKNAAKLLDVPLEQDCFNACTTYYFAADEFPSEKPLIHLIPKNKGAILHFSCLSDVQAFYSPKGKKLISVTSLNKDIDPKDIAEELKGYTGNLKGLRFLKSYFIPHALPRVGRFESLKHKAKELNVSLLGDYVGFPSLQSAFE